MVSNLQAPAPTGPSQLLPSCSAPGGHFFHNRFNGAYIVEKDTCPYGSPIRVGGVQEWGKVDENTASDLLFASCILEKQEEKGKELYPAAQPHQYPEKGDARESSRRRSEFLAPYTDMGDPDEVSDSWLQPGQFPAIVAI